MTATRPASRTARVLLLAVAAAILATVGLAPAPASASVTGSKHILGCQLGRVLANVGTVVTSQEEEVYWQPYLFVATNQGWALATDVAQPNWAVAGAVNGRTGTWWDSKTWNTVQFRPFNVRAGQYYAIVNRFWTASGGFSTSISYTNAGSYYCQL